MWKEGNFFACEQIKFWCFLFSCLCVIVWCLQQIGYLTSSHAASLFFAYLIHLFSITGYSFLEVFLRIIITLNAPFISVMYLVGIVALCRLIFHELTFFTLFPQIFMISRFLLQVAASVDWIMNEEHFNERKVI